MPGQSGFELLQQLTGHTPQVIFTTAYDVHAVRALKSMRWTDPPKPIDPARLAVSLRRWKNGS